MIQSASEFMWLFGAWVTGCGRGRAVGEPVFYNDLYEYDPSENEWTTLGRQV
jgi:N-acetylneuraminic acid mutarotase